MLRTVIALPGGFCTFESGHAAVPPRRVPAAGAIAAPLPAVGDPACVIVQPTDNGPQLRAVLDGIPKRLPGFTGVEYRDPSRIRIADLFRQPQEWGAACGPGLRMATLHA